MMKEKKTFQPLTSKDICEIYSLLYSEGLISFPIVYDAAHKIDAIVSNVNGNSFGVPHYSTTKEKIFAYFYFIIKNHPFTDGNKRTATLVFLVLCEMNNIKTEMAGFDLDTLAVFLEQFNLLGHQEIIKIIAEEFIRSE